MEIKFTEIFTDLCEDKNQINLAKEIGINQSQISRYLQGTIPTISSVVKICDYFDCSIDYISGLNEKKKYSLSQNGYNNKIFYEHYKNALNKNNLTHYQLAKKNIVCETSLRLWKTGRLPNFEVLYNIANYLNVSIDYLLGRINKM